MIRPYLQTDLEKLIELLDLNTPEFFHPMEREEFREYLKEKREDYFVIEMSGKIVGGAGINYFPSEGIARFSWDLIHPEFQKKGLGLELSQFRMDRIKDRGTITKIVVRTTPEVFPFYEKMGFKTVLVKKDFWAPGFDLQEMHLSL